MDLKVEVAEIYGLKKRVSSGEEEVRGRLDVLRKSILRGGSTGDPITDFVIASQGDLSEGSEQHYRNLQRMIRGKGGEPIFVARINETHDHNREPASMFETLMHIGILDSKTLGFHVVGGTEEYTPSIISDPTSRQPHINLHKIEEYSHVILPTLGHVIKQTYLISPSHTTSYNPWNLKEKVIRVGALEMIGGILEDYGLISERTFATERDGEHSMRFPLLKGVVIKVGDEQVRKFFENQSQHESSEYDRAMKLL